MPEPGDIISEAKVTGKDLYGRYWIEGCGVKGYIQPRHLPADCQLKPKQVIHNLICLPKKKSQPFALVNYEAELIRYFYSVKGDEARNPEVWIPRWQEAASAPTEVFCDKPDEPSSLPLPPTYRKWQFARMPEWMMPVTSSAHTDFQTNRSSAFCPSPLSRNPYTLSSVYRTELFSKTNSPPLCYQAALELPKLAKPVRIYLHGSLDPKKWHYGIWNHLLCATPYSDERGEEKELWESWLGCSLPSDSETDDIFKNCSARKGNCATCSSDQFQKVHPSLETLSEIYWHRIVTFWESSATKQVEFEKNPKHDFHEFEIKVFSRKILSLNGKAVFRYPFLFIKGWGYDFDDTTEKESVLNLNAVTFFFKPRNPLISPKPELKNVTRL